MSQFYCREDELRKLNKRYAGDKFVPQPPCSLAVARTMTF